MIRLIFSGENIDDWYFQEKGEIAKLLCEDWQGDECEKGDWQCAFHWNGELDDHVDDNDVDDVICVRSLEFNWVT